MVIMKIRKLSEDSTYIKKCEEISFENEKYVKEIRKLQGRVGGIEKEFYDKLFF